MKNENISYLALGLCFGVVLGSLFKNLAIGLSFGLIIGVVLDSKKNK
ncbi:TPA: hypothetical protein KQG29_002803 [Clostridioides difficile]|nr:hypothetical protein [Clostridioides difficile]